MMMSYSKSPLYLLLLSAIIGWNFFHCGRSPSETSLTGCGSIHVSALVKENLKKVSAVAATSFENLVLEVYGNGMDTLRFSSKVSNNPTTLNDTFNGIPAGKDREVKIYTTDNKGLRVHIDSLDNRIVRIDRNDVTTINATLIPAAGSIYMQLANVSTDIDSIFLKFISTGGIWEKRLKRNLKMNLTLDNIPDGTEGTVYFTAVKVGGDTLYHASKKIIFNARELTELEFIFDLLPVSVAMDIRVERPGVTLVTFNMADLPNSEESGELIITEIMYNAPDSFQYIKVYNPSGAPVTIDTLIIEVDKSRKKIASVTINAYDSYKLQLDLTKNGNLITLRAKDNTVIDRVIYIGTTNELEWPETTFNKAICLDSASYDVKKNNFGRNWYACDP
jgi:hypothetical protein